MSTLDAFRPFADLLDRARAEGLLLDELGDPTLSAWVDDIDGSMPRRPMVSWTHRTAPTAAPQTLSIAPDSTGKLAAIASNDRRADGVDAVRAFLALRSPPRRSCPHCGAEHRALCPECKGAGSAGGNPCGTCGVKSW